MVVHAFAVLHGECELVYYQNKRFFKIFLEVKDNMPLKKNKEGENRLTDGQFKTCDLIYLITKLLFYSFKQYEDRKKNRV
ncbi:hypothetical protein CJ485_00720 [Priestia filamentosa]|nr:hypothetical protein CJ485_00720 [Priestia filamentosa]